MIKCVFKMKSGAEQGVVAGSVPKAILSLMGNISGTPSSERFGLSQEYVANQAWLGVFDSVANPEGVEISREQAILDLQAYMKETASDQDRAVVEKMRNDELIPGDFGL
jgi:hypothetical protein